MLVKRLKSDDDLLDLTETRYKQIKDLFQTFSIEDISKIIGLLIDMFKDLKTVKEKEEKEMQFWEEEIKKIKEEIEKIDSNIFSKTG